MFLACRALDCRAKADQAELEADVAVAVIDLDGLHVLQRRSLGGSCELYGRT